MKHIYKALILIPVIQARPLEKRDAKPHHNQALNNLHPNEDQHLKSKRVISALFNTKILF